jgi:hypothetical protein
MVRVCCAVVNRPRTVLLTEDNVTGWLAMDWTSLEPVPMKRWIIVFPFVAEKAFPSRRIGRSGSLVPCIRKIACRRVAVD